MQWSDAKHGGFSTARRPVKPVISDPIYGYARVNVAEQRRDPDSLLSWMARALRMRKECVEIGWGDWRVLPPGADGLLVMRYEWQGQAFVAAHNVTSKSTVATLGERDVGGRRLVSLFASEHSEADESGRHLIELEPHGYRWYKVGGTDVITPGGQTEGIPGKKPRRRRKQGSA
jgi:maltose alpha-D-glucosyltransferase/alpha-amylase